MKVRDLRRVLDLCFNEDEITVNGQIVSAVHRHEETDSTIAYESSGAGFLVGTGSDFVREKKAARVDLVGDDLS